MSAASRTAFGWRGVAAAVSCTVLIGCIAIVLLALAFGYRPVVITTGSMGDAAPTGSLVIAQPKPAAEIEVGDIIVMRRPDTSPVTHRVVEIEHGAAGPFAITQGDANATPDVSPYALGDGELVARWVTPSAGTALVTLRDPRFALVALGFLLAAAAVLALRRIWADDRGRLVPGQPLPPPAPAAPHHGRRVAVGIAVTVAVMLLGAGVAFSLQTETVPVTANTFATAGCFDAQLTSVQSGSTVHATSGAVVEPIGPVDPARSFVMASIRSASNEPADSTATVRLSGAATVEVRRDTDAGSPPAVTVDWSVVEYGCGVDVQRGVVFGDASNRLDIPVASVDMASSFVLVTSTGEPGAIDFGDEDLYAGELTTPTNLAIVGAAGAGFPAGQSFAWQVVTFSDAADIDVQIASSTLGVGVLSDSLTLAGPVDLDSTFLIASMKSDAAGPAVGDRLVRAHLSDPTTIQVERLVAGDPVDVRVQVVSLHDGTTVRHGTVDFTPGQATRTATVEPVDVSRSTAVSTVAVPGASAGGMTDFVADDMPGEASATFAVTDPTTVTIARDASSSNASFGWQVIEWAGPQWWDPGYDFRQRIDVDATTVAAPGEYTVPVTVDHAALVAAGLARTDGDDLRVLRWDGAIWTELDRLLDDDSAWNQSDTTVWFRTTDPIAAGGTQTYWLYYADPTAGPAPSDADAVYLLTENFDAGGLGDFEDRTGGTGWYAASPWVRRLPVTVPAGRVTSSLTDFALLVSVTEADLGSNAQPDGSDIRFTAVDGVTVLPHEIESYQPVTGALEAWVRVPIVSASSATTIYLYYGAADAPSQESVAGTWSDDVEAVWHMDRDPAGSAPQLDDSSGRNHDGLSLGSMAGGDLVPGLIGGALDFDGVDDAVEAQRFDVNGTTGLTVSGWINLAAFSNDGRIFSKAIDPFDRVVDLSVRVDGTVRARLGLDTGDVELLTAPAVVSTGTWHHVSMSWDGNDLVVVVDGTGRGIVAAVGQLGSGPEMPVHLGNVATLDRQLDGVLDEVRVETVARPVAWLAAAEMNQRTPASFYGVGAVETGSWFDQGVWAYRKPVVVAADQVSSDLFDFPLMVKIVDAELQAAGQPCACDVVFTGADGTTRLDHQVEAYDPGTGALTAWVSVPVLSGSGDTTLFLYYGNPTATDQQDPAAVFGPEADLQMLGAP